MLLWICVPVLDHPHSKNNFHISCQNFPSSILCLLPPSLLLCSFWEKLAQSSLSSPVRYLKTAIISCLSLPFFHLKKSWSVFLSSQSKCFSHWTSFHNGPLLNSLQFVNIIISLGSLKLDSRLGLTSAKQRGRMTSLNQLAALLFIQPWILVAFCWWPGYTAGSCWIYCPLRLSTHFLHLVCHLPVQLPRGYSVPSLYIFLSSACYLQAL